MSFKNIFIAFLVLLVVALTGVYITTKSANDALLTSTPQPQPVLPSEQRKEEDRLVQNKAIKKFGYLFKIMKTSDGKSQAIFTLAEYFEGEQANIEVRKDGLCETLENGEEQCAPNGKYVRATQNQQTFPILLDKTLVKINESELELIKQKALPKGVTRTDVETVLQMSAQRFQELFGKVPSEQILPFWITLTDEGVISEMKQIDLP